MTDLQNIAERKAALRAEEKAAVDALEARRVEQVTAEQAKRDEAAIRKAEIDNHPTNRMRAFIVDLTKRHGDVNDRISALQRAVVGILTLMLVDAPEPPVYDGADPVLRTEPVLDEHGNPVLDVNGKPTRRVVPGQPTPPYVDPYLPQGQPPQRQSLAYPPSAAVPQPTQRRNFSDDR